MALAIDKRVVSDLTVFELCKCAVMLCMSSNSSSKQQRESRVISYR